MTDRVEMYRKACADRNCEHDKSTHYRDYIAESSYVATRGETSGPMYGDCLSAGCGCKGYVER